MSWSLFNSVSTIFCAMANNKRKVEHSEDDSDRKRRWREQDNYSNDDGKLTTAQSQDSGFSQKDELDPIANPSNHLITDLVGQGKGISFEDVGKLFKAGYKTVESFASSPKKDLFKVNGLSLAKINQLLTAASNLLPSLGFTTATEFHKKRCQNILITTGSTAIDNLLGGGIESGTIAEIFGPSGSGKSQICHTLAVTCQLPVEQGGAASKCFYMYTESGFHSKLLVAIGQRFNIDQDTVLANVLQSKAYNSDIQTKLLGQVLTTLIESKDEYGLLIVDSATSLYRSDYNSEKEICSRQVHLGGFMRTLLRLTNDFGIAVVITNQMVADPGGPNVYGTGSSLPAGGNILAHATTTRLGIRKGIGSERIARLYKSQHLPENETTFVIRDDGIGDTTE